MKKVLVVLFIYILQFVNSASADIPKPYKFEIVRNGKVYHQVVSQFWEGEYPSPVININSQKKGTTTITGYESFKDKTKQKLCRVKNGLYHPWTQDDTSIINLYTINPVISYEIIKKPSMSIQSNFNLDAKTQKRGLKIGDKIFNIVYISEGNSEGILRTKEQKEILISLSTNVFIENPKFFKQIEKSSSLPKLEQWLYLKCVDNTNVFVQDKDLLLQKGIKEGQVLGGGISR